MWQLAEPSCLGVGHELATSPNLLRKPSILTRCRQLLAPHPVTIGGEVWIETVADSTETSNPFSNFQTACQQSDLTTALAGLADHLLQNDRLHELFEVRKLQLRDRLGLSVGQWQPIDELPASEGKALESGLLEICSEVGELLMKQGDVAAGWQYLEPVGDRQRVADLLLRSR